MDPRTRLVEYVERKGGVAAAALELNIGYPSLYAIVKGWRGVGKKTAKHLAASSHGELKAADLIWIRATRKQGEAA
jgi:hypothetical protein